MFFFCSYKPVGCSGGKVGAEWWFYFTLELAKLEWENESTFKELDNAQSRAEAASLPHYSALFALVKAHLALAHKKLPSVSECLTFYAKTQHTYCQCLPEQLHKDATWGNLYMMFNILSLEHSFLMGDVKNAKRHAKSICTYMQLVKEDGGMRSFFKWCDLSMLGAFYYYAGGAVSRISAPDQAVKVLDEGCTRIERLLSKNRMYSLVREEQGLVVEIMKTREKEVINLLRFKFGILEQLFLAYFIQCDYVHAVQELWKMLEMNCMWSSQNPEWSSTIHVLAGHLASVCLPKYAANHYINASQILQGRDSDKALLADLFACLALLRESTASKKAPLSTPRKELASHSF